MPARPATWKGEWLIPALYLRVDQTHLWAEAKTEEEFRHPRGKQIDRIQASLLTFGNQVNDLRGPTIDMGDKHVETGGGAYIRGNVKVDGDFVGRDKTVYGDEVRGDKITTGDISDNANVAMGRGASTARNDGVRAEELAALFEPILAAIQAAPQDSQNEALADAKELQEEVARGEKADDKWVARLIDGLVALVPGAVGAVVAAFASPILAGVAGPVTQYVLDRIGGK